MRSSQPGASTSDVEVTNVGSHGVWLFVRGAEHFLPYEDFPWFKQARVGDILNVELLHESHLYWPALDVDLCVESLAAPEGFPLIYR